jgi:hypothetical protein
MKQKTLIMIVGLAIFSTIALPLINVFLTTPAFTSFVIRHAEKKLTEIASNISSVIDIHQDSIHDDTVLDHRVVAKIQETKSLFDLEKIKVFSSNGRIIYSTEPKEIGSRTRKDFFEVIIKDNRTYSDLDINKLESGADGVTVQTLLETYVPIPGKSGAIGAFEIYYDISKIKEEFEGIITQINFVVLAIALLLLSSVIISAVYAYKSFTIQRKVEGEKDKLIDDLTKTFNEINTLRGILPLCSFCKKIRDDSGYWEQVDVYIGKYSDADISHGICPQCMKEHYPKEYAAIKLKKGEK